VIRLVAEGYDREAATRLVYALFLGPDASDKDVFVVARNILEAKRKAEFESRASFAVVGKSG
jgi:hypothetical protein